MSKICAKCKKEMVINSNSQKYCKDCAYIVHLENNKKRSAERRLKKDGTFGANPVRKKDGSINFNAEQRAILREMKRLGLR